MILDVIAAELPQMSAAKRAVGEFVLTNWRYTAFLNAAQLAAQAGVSESVVVRFTKELGLTGFPDFQERIQDLVMREMGILDLYKDSSLTQPASIDERIQQSLDSDMAILTQTMHGLSADDAVASARTIVAARSVVILATRSTRGPGAIASVYLNAVLANTTMLEDNTSEIYDQLRKLDERDVVIAFLGRYYDRNTMSQIAFAREHGVKLILITDSPAAPFSQEAEHVLCVQMQSPGFYRSHVGTVALVNLLLLLVGTLGDAEQQTANLAEMQMIYDRFYYSKPLARGGMPVGTPTDR